MLFSAALVLSTAASALASLQPRGDHGHNKRTPKLYAWADVVNEKNGIHLKVEITGFLDGTPTFLKFRGLGGLTKDLVPGGVYGYHLHTNPVPADGNCTKTLAHLDPLNATQGFICDPAFPEYCETGDLSGKHGKLNGTTDGKIASFGYSDPFVRFFPESHSVLGRSIVIHAPDKSRLACGNILSTLDGTANYDHEPTGKPSKYVKHYPTSAPVQPTPVVIPFNGTQMTDPAVIATFPHPLPIPALRLDEALNVKLVNITHSVKFANSEQTITQPKEEKVDGKGPFKGTWDTTW